MIEWLIRILFLLFLWALAIAAVLAGILAIGLFVGAQFTEGPAVDFSREGQTCQSDQDCLPSPDFEGASPTCFEGTCVWQKYLTHSEVYTGLAFMLAFFVALPLGVFLLLGRWLWNRSKPKETALEQAGP